MVATTAFHVTLNECICWVVTALSLHARSRITGNDAIATTAAPCPSPTIILGRTLSASANNWTIAELICDLTFLTIPSGLRAYGFNQ